jgi:hypothetical protein
MADYWEKRRCRRRLLLLQEAAEKGLLMSEHESECEGYLHTWFVGLTAEASIPRREVVDVAL